MNWEYMCQRLAYDSPDIEKGLDELGKMGWELVSSGPVISNFDRRSVLMLFFKREIVEPPNSEEEAKIAPLDYDLPAEPQQTDHWDDNDQEIGGVDDGIC